MIHALEKDANSLKVSVAPFSSFFCVVFCLGSVLVDASVIGWAWDLSSHGLGKMRMSCAELKFYCRIPALKGAGRLSAGVRDCDPV